MRVTSSVAAASSLTLAELTRQSRESRTRVARAVAAYLLRTVAGMSAIETAACMRMPYGTVLDVTRRVGGQIEGPEASLLARVRLYLSIDEHCAITSGVVLGR
jgi:chromosomal replication initiation ATPase DnaA